MADARANWYYVIDGERCGPVTESQIETMFGDGALEPKSLVWTQGMTEWEPASSVFGKRRLCLSCGAHLNGGVACECASEKAKTRRRAPKQSPTPENHFAVAGFVVSLIALPLALFTCGLSAIPAMVFSIMGMVHTHNHPASGGRSLAVMGFLISLFSFLVPMLIALGVIWFFSHAS